MNVTFNIEYITQWGEELFLVLNNDQNSAVKMYYTPGSIWTTTLNISDATSQLRYRYMVKVGGDVARIEKCPSHILALATGIAQYRVNDSWDDNEGVGTGTDFIHRLLKTNDVPVAGVVAQGGSIVIEAMVPMGDRKMTPAVVGEAAALGAWNVRKAIKMQPCGTSRWRAAIEVLSTQLPTQYKLVCIAPGRQGEVEWETGGNRWLCEVPNDNEVLILPGLKFRSQEGKKNRQVATFVDVLSLRSERDMGVGDLGDLKKIILWAASCGQNAIVLNSLADVNVVEGWMPEQLLKQVAENAIDPIHIRPSALGSLADKKIKARYQQAGMVLNAMDSFTANDVRNLKLDYCREIFAQIGATEVRNAAYRRFVAENAEWLHAYAAQFILQRVKGTADSTRWGNYATYETANVEKFIKARHREASLIYYLQFQLRQQLLEGAKFAQEKGIDLQCDMTSNRYVKLMDAHEPWVNERRIIQRLQDGEGQILIALRDWMLIDGNWCARLAKVTGNRLPVSTEELVGAGDFNTRIQKHLKDILS